MAEHQYLLKREAIKKRPHDLEKTTPSTTPLNLETADLLDLQRVIGNQGVQRLLAQRKSDLGKRPSVFIQAKLAVGPANDRYEQEADHVAEQVMSMPDHAQRQEDEEELQMSCDYLQRQEDEEELQMSCDYLQRQEDEEELQMSCDYLQRQEDEEELQMSCDYLQRQEDEEELQMSCDDLQRQEDEEELQMSCDIIERAGMDGAFEVGGALEEGIRSQKGGGQPLPGETQDFFETRFGRDFSNVRVHDSSQSDSISRSIQARAFTTGADIFFRQGTYNPNNQTGQTLLAHELTYVIQQGGAEVREKQETD